MYLHRKMLHLPVALNPKELVGNMSIAFLMATLVLLGSLFQVYSEHISKFLRVTHRPTNQPNSRLYI